MRSERSEASVGVRGGVRFEVHKFEINSGEESQFGRSGMEIGMNNVKFRICIGFEIEKFKREIMCDVRPMRQRKGAGNPVYCLYFPMKTECNVSGSLNNSMKDLCDVVVFL